MERSAAEFLQALLKIPELAVADYEVQPKEVVMHAELLVHAARCPDCKSISHDVHQYLPRRVRHLPMAGRPCYLVYDEYQYACGKCGKTWVGIVDFVEAWRSYTNAYEQYIARRCHGTTWEKVARDEGLSAEAVEGIYKRVVDAKIEGREDVPVRVLGIDELRWRKSPKREYAAVIMDIERGRVIDVLEDRSKAALEAYFGAWSPERRRAVEVVSMDMWEPYASMARTCFPRADVVVDRFHVMKNLQEHLQNARRAAQRELSEEQRKQLKGLRWLLVRNFDDLSPQDQRRLREAFKVWPELGVLHALKERFRDFYERKNPRTAEKALDGWIARALASGHRALQTFVKTLTRWRQEILAYFDERITQGFVEGTNNGIRSILHRCFGFKVFGNLRMRVLDEFGGLAKSQV